MVTDELVKFIRMELKRNVGRDDIIRLLTEQSSAGWLRNDIEEAFSIIDSPLPSTSATSIKKQVRSSVFKTPKKVKFALLAVTFIILFIGGAVLAYSFLSKVKSPETIIYETFANWLQIKSYTFSGELSLSTYLNLDESSLPNNNTNQLAGLFLSTINIETSEDFNLAEQEKTEQPIALLITFNGAKDTHDAKNFKLTADTEIKLALPGMNNFALNTEARIIKNTLFFKFSNLTPLILDTSNFSNKWMNFTKDNIVKYIEPYDAQASQELNQKIDQYLSEGQDNSIANQKELMDLAKKLKIIMIKKVFADQEINGSLSSHYSLGINWSNFKKYFEEALNITKQNQNFETYIKDIEESLFAFTGAKQEDKEKILSEIIKYLDKNLQMEIWIDKNLNLPTQTLFRVTIEPQGSTGAFGLGAKELNTFDNMGRTNIAFRSTFSKFNEPLIIETPVDSLSFIEVFGLDATSTTPWSSDEILDSISP
jgi:hypothetical protein